MSPKTEKLLEEVLRLPLEEREFFAAHLLESLDDEFADEAAWSAEIKRRVEYITSGKVQTTPWQDVRQRILAYKGD